jgi:hypothetical protein
MYVFPTRSPCVLLCHLFVGQYKQGCLEFRSVLSIFSPVILCQYSSSCTGEGRKEIRLSNDATHTTRTLIDCIIVVCASDSATEYHPLPEKRSRRSVTLIILWPLHGAKNAQNRTVRVVVGQRSICIFSLFSTYGISTPRVQASYSNRWNTKWHLLKFPEEETIPKMIHEKKPISPNWFCFYISTFWVKTSKFFWYLPKF